jgi:hypothetical protein
MVRFLFDKSHSLQQQLHEIIVGIHENQFKVIFFQLKL